MNTMPPSEQDTFKPNSQLRLEVHSGPLAGKGFPFVGDSLTFGRAPDNDITLDDAQVSRYHSVLRRQGNEVIIQDLDSTNGTLVNGERVFGPHVLQPTETITIGTSVFSVSGFPAPSTVSMAAQTPSDGWSAYQSGGTRPEVQSGQSSGNWLLWSGILLLIGLVMAIVAVSVLLFRESRPGDNEAVRPSVIISSPVTGSSFNVDQRVIVQATATDAQGVIRLELWVAGQKIDEEVSPITTGQSPFTAVLEWSAQAPGSYSLEVRAFNRQGNQSAPTIVNVNVLGEGAGVTPDAGTPTLETGAPQAVIQTNLNVRTGPGIEFDTLGVLQAGDVVEVVGKNSDASWWHIVFPASADQRGWIASQFATGRGTDNVPVVNTPTPYPTPSPTPVVQETATFTPTPEPTNTPTVPVQLTATPTSTPTPTNTPTPTATVAIEPNVTFSADPLNLKSGECTTFSWIVTNVKAVYFDDQGVAGDSNGQPVTRRECPRETRTYRLRWLRMDDREDSREIQITVRPKPNAPENLQIVETTAQGFRLTWSDESDNEDGFRIYDADRNNVLLTVDNNSTSATVSGLNCNTTYRLYVVAYDRESGESTPSNIVTQQTSPCS